MSKRSTPSFLKNHFNQRDNNFASVTCATILLMFASNAFAWSGPFDISNKRLIVTDKPLIAIKDYACHPTGGFLFRVESSSKFKRVGKIVIKFYDKNGDPVGSIAEEYNLGPKSQTLMAKYSPCNAAKAFTLRHLPLI